MELIDKRAAYEALKHEAEMHELPFTREAYERAARIIDQMYAYTIESEPVRHGQWIDKDNTGDDWDGETICALCGGVSPCRLFGDLFLDFCPYFYSRMDGGDGDAAD